MNRFDDFEEQIRRQPLRPIPPAWRDQILTTACSACVPERPEQACQRQFVARARLWASALFWPHPRAWAGLAAVWVAVLAMNWASREPIQQQTAARKTPAPSPQLRELLHQQERMFAELVGPDQKTDADKPKSLPRPHSQLREEVVKT